MLCCYAGGDNDEQINNNTILDRCLCCLVSVWGPDINNIMQLTSDNPSSLEVDKMSDLCLNLLTMLVSKSL